MVALVTYAAFHCLVLAAACSMIRRKERSPAWVLLVFFFPPAIYALRAMEAKGRGYGEPSAAETLSLLVPPATVLMAVFLHLDRARHAGSIVDQFPDCRSERAVRDVKRVWDGSVAAQNMDITLVRVSNAVVVPSLPGQEECEADFVFSNETVAHYDFSYDVERGMIFVHTHLIGRGKQYL